jgi:hypothetical protein
MTAAEFVAELQRRGKWEIEAAYDGEGPTWRKQPVFAVREKGFECVAGDMCWDKEGDHWRFPEPERMPLEEWLEKRAERQQERVAYEAGLLLDDWRAGEEP